MIDLDAFEAELRACIGIPWRHIGRKGLPYGHQTGLDCVGLLIRAAAAGGRVIDDIPVYSRQPDGSLEAKITERLGSPVAPEPGCVVLINMVRLPSHVGYITRAGTLTHAYNGGTGVVCEHPLALWANRIVKGWAL